ncbi:MAG: ABC transporter substrate binding protein [Bacteroidales bacterium]
MIRLLQIFCIMCLFGFQKADANTLKTQLQQEEKTVYFITSYNDNNEWSRRVRSELSSQFRKSDLLVNMRSIYLCVNTFDKEARKQILLSYLNGVKEKIDLLVVSDYGATESVFSLTEEERKNIPVVFVSEYDLKNLPRNRGNITGGIARIAFEETFLEAKRMFPNAAHVYVWADKTPVGRYYLREAKQQLAKYEKEISIEYGVNALNKESFLEQAYELPYDSFVLFCTWQQDDSRQYHNPEYFYPLLNESAQVPMFALVDNLLRSGFVGGHVVSPKKYGEVAAKKAIAILNGKSPEDIPIEVIGNTLVLNQRVMKKWNLPEPLLSRNARIVNWEVPSHKAFRNKVKGVKIALSAMVLVMLLLFILYWQRRKRLKESLFRETVLRQTKEKLRFKSEVLSDTISTLREGFLILNCEMIILECNDIFCSLVENDRENIIGEHIDDVFGLADIDGLTPIFEDILEGRVSRKTISPTFLVSHKGVSRYIEGFALPLTGKGGDSQGAILLLYDVLDELRQQKIRSVSLHTLNAYTWFYDVNQDNFIFGDSFLQTGADVDEIKSFGKFVEKVHPQDKVRFDQFFKNVIQHKQPEFSITFQVDFKGNGEYEWRECRGITESTQLGNQEIIYLYGLDLNITNQKKVEKDLIRAKNKAESANQLKSAFLANMSHEIRTPLNAIVGFCELLTSADCNPEQKEEYGRVIMDNNELLLKLINDILDLSKIESGLMDFTLTQFDLSEFIQNTKLMFEHKVPSGVHLEVQNQYPHYRVVMDKEKLSQVVNNFVNNAIKFTADGSITIGYKIVDNRLELFVSDTGMGIKHVNQKKIFERFEKLNSHTPGTGLGLAICKAIVDAAGGQIDVVSEYGQGTTFLFRIPLKLIGVTESLAQAEKPQLVSVDNLVN